MAVRKKNLGLSHINLFPIPIGTKEFNLENEKTRMEIDQDNAGISFFKVKDQNILHLTLM